jgi:hypothetical protein
MATKDTSSRKEGKGSRVLAIFLILKVAVLIGRGQYHSSNSKFLLSSSTQQACAKDTLSATWQVWQQDVSKVDGQHL